MTLANGSMSAAGDVTLASSLSTLASDNAQKPLAVPLTFIWKNLSNTSATKSFVMPFDGYLETLAVQAADQTAASTVTCAVTSTGVLDAFPVQVTGTAGTGITKLSRLLYDGTRASVASTQLANNRAFRVLPKGSTVVVTMTTTSTATPSALQATLLLRSFFARAT